VDIAVPPFRYWTVVLLQYSLNSERMTSA